MTVSLDSLDDETFKRMNDVDFPVQKVLDGMDAAAQVGLGPIKVNMVVKRGLNESSILPMARFFREKGYILRFIEYMDVGHSNGWRLDDVVPAAEIVKMIHAEMPLEPADPNYTGEVAERWRYKEGGGEIGVIASVTQAFCSTCTRARLSAEGKLYTCLFAVKGFDLRELAAGRCHGRGDLPGHRPRLGQTYRPLFRDPFREHDLPAQGGDVAHWGKNPPVSPGETTPPQIRQLNSL